MNFRVSFLVLLTTLTVTAFQNCAKENFSQSAPSLFSNTGATPTGSPSGTNTTTVGGGTGNLPVTYGCSNKGTSSAGTNLLETAGVVLQIYQVTYGNDTATLTSIATPKIDAVALRDTILQNKSIPLPVSSLGQGTYTALLCPSDANGTVDTKCSISLQKARVGPNGQISMSNVTLGDSDLAPNTKFAGDHLVTFDISSADQLSAPNKVDVLYDTNNNNANQNQCDDTASPLMIHLDDLGRSGVELSSPQNGVMFDILNDGVKNRISWPTHPSVDVFIALPDEQGQITSSQELFGNETIGPDGQRAANGFLALAKWAPAGIKAIDSSQPIYSKLRLWADVNRDGVVDQGELYTLSEKGITSINLNYQNINEIDIYGNQTRERSSAVSDLGAFAIFDLWFKY